MRYKIEELKDITDSREIMQSKPKGFGKYMAYIIILLLIFCIVWSIFAGAKIKLSKQTRRHCRGECRLDIPFGEKDYSFISLLV